MEKIRVQTTQNSILCLFEVMQVWTKNKFNEVGWEQVFDSNVVTC